MLLRKGVCFPALAAVMATSAAVPAFAGDGLYVGASVGSSLFHADKSDYDSAVVEAFNETGLAVISGTSTLNKSSVNYSGVIGYQFMRELAVEASYTDLGKLRYHANDTLAIRATAATELDAKAKGPTVAVIGALPLSQEWVGLAWNPTKHVKLRAEYIRYGNVGDKDTTGEINIDTFNAGLTYSF